MAEEEQIKKIAIEKSFDEFKKEGAIERTLRLEK